MTQQLPRSHVHQLPNQTLFTGDNLDILRGMNSDTVDLIYLDPPFNSKRTYAAPIGSRAAGAEFKDTWSMTDVKVEWLGMISEQNEPLANIINASRGTANKSMQAYLTYMAVRLLEMERVLKPSGSIYLHCDPTAAHYLKAVMDATFGARRFRREIIWSIETASGFKSRARNWVRGHDTLLYYADPKTCTFNRLTQPLAERTIARYDKTDASGRKYKIYHRGASRRHVYLDESQGRPFTDCWTDIIGFQTVNRQKEQTYYPTQKPLALLLRIIEASSNAGDVVFDPFCGCATTLVASENLQRNWIGVDISPRAVDLVQARFRTELPLLTLKLNHQKSPPKRTDGVQVRSADILHILYGLQEGKCAGCKHHFHFRNLTKDHITPRSKGGTDADDNLQLLCGACNSTKGDRDMVFLIATLRRNGIIP